MLLKEVQKITKNKNILKTINCFLADFDYLNMVETDIKTASTELKNESFLHRKTTYANN